MAQAWGVSKRCVMYRRQQVLTWLGATNMCQAVYLACREGILK